MQDVCDARWQGLLRILATVVWVARRMALVIGNADYNEAAANLADRQGDHNLEATALGV